LPDASEWTVVTAKRQTKGRGKPGSSWFSPDGGLYFSVILKPRKNSADLSPVTLLAAEAVASVIKAEIKPPNDLMIKSKKVCGILTEKVKDALIVGVGLNVNIEKFPDELAATSLYLENNKKYDPDQLLSEIIIELKNRYLKFLHNRI